MDANYIVHFEYGNTPAFGWLRAAMREELVRVYHMFCDIANGGLCDKLNKEFFQEHPNYKIADDLWSSVEYVQHFHRAYSEIADNFNRERVSPLLEFFIGEELDFCGRLKANKNATISFYLKQEGS